MRLSVVLKHEREALTILAVGLWIVIAVLSLLPGDERPHTGASGNVEHLVAYAGTACITALAFRRMAPVWLVLAFSAASGMFEITQVFIPGRSSGIDNWIASSLGALAGILIARRLVRPWLDRRTGTPHPPQGGQGGHRS